MRIARLTRDVNRRLSSAALAIALVAAQGASLAHLAIVPHAICPVHGELVEIAPHAPITVHPAGPDGRSSMLPSDEGPSAFSDDHCAVVGHRRDVALPASPNALLPGNIAAAVSRLDVAGVPVTSEPRFRVAPKQSPPA